MKLILVDVPIIQIKGHLEDPEYPHDPDKPEHLAHPAHHQRVLHALQDEAEVVREDCQQVDNVQGPEEELLLVGSAGEPRDELDGEEGHGRVVQDLQSQDSLISDNGPAVNC